MPDTSIVPFPAWAGLPSWLRADLESALCRLKSDLGAIGMSYCGPEDLNVRRSDPLRGLHREAVDDLYTKTEPPPERRSALVARPSGSVRDEEEREARRRDAWRFTLRESSYFCMDPAMPEGIRLLGAVVVLGSAALLLAENPGDLGAVQACHGMARDPDAPPAARRLVRALRDGELDPRRGDQRREVQNHLEDLHLLANSLSFESPGPMPVEVINDIDEDETGGEVEAPESVPVLMLAQDSDYFVTKEGARLPTGDRGRHLRASWGDKAVFLAKLAASSTDGEKPVHHILQRSADRTEVDHALRKAFGIRIESRGSNRFALSKPLRLHPDLEYLLKSDFRGTA